MQLLKLTGRDICSSETHQVTAESLKTFRIVQQGEVSLLRVAHFWKLFFRFLFVVRLISQPQPMPINKPAKPNNKRMLIFHFVDQVQKDR